jgi:hypothetical protein
MPDSAGKSRAKIPHAVVQNLLIDLVSQPQVDSYGLSPRKSKTSGLKRSGFVRWG